MSAEIATVIFYMPPPQNVGKLMSCLVLKMELSWELARFQQISSFTLRVEGLLVA